MKKNLKKEIAAVLNRACRENNTDTPDFILAQYLISCLKAGEKLIQDRDNFYGVHTSPRGTYKINKKKEEIK